MTLDELGRAVPPFEQRLERPLGEYWFDRLDRHFSDSYAGVLLLKFPEDLRVYEHLLWDMHADAVIEIGAESGGSALWFRDRLAALQRYRPGPSPLVVSIDLSTSRAREQIARVDPAHADSIKLVDADVRDDELPARIRALVPEGARCLVVEDSAHTYETTRAALEGFASFVPPGGWFVAEDGCVDVEELRPTKEWPRGVRAAVDKWLQTPAGAAFEQRRSAEVYGLTSHPGGFLRRIN